MDNVEELTEDNFQDVIKDKNKLVIVEFYTTKCPNCVAIAPVYSKLSMETDIDAKFAKLNAETSPFIAQMYGVMGTPTFKFFCNGEPIGEIVGAVNAVIIKNQIKDFVRFRKECRSKSTKLVPEISGYG